MHRLMHIIWILQFLFFAHHGTACFPAPKHDILAIQHHLARRQVTPAPKSTSINNVSVFDGLKLSPPQAVLIANGTIVSIGNTSYSEAEVQIDGRGKFLIPGLIDSHVHIQTYQELDLLASYGVTTAVNMACYDNDLCWALRSLTGTASFITASPPAVGNGSFHSHLGPSTLPTLSPTDNTTAWVAQNAFPPGTAAAFLKATAEPSGPDQETLSGLVAAAHDMGHYAVMHASYLSAYEQAVTAWVDGIQHMPADKIMPESMAQRIKAQGQFVTPTMAIFRVGANTPLLGQLLQQNFTWSTSMANAQVLYQAGIPLLAGTDSTNLGDLNLTMPYGLGLHCELEYLVEAGLSPLEALQAATIRPAQIQNLYDRGVIYPGKRADLVLLNSNPLKNVSNTRDVARVWVEGTEFDHITRNLTQQCSELTLYSNAGLPG